MSPTAMRGTTCSRRSWPCRPPTRISRTWAQIKSRQDAQAAKLRADAQGQAQAIEALHFIQRRQASDEGRLFGSVGRADLAAFLAQHGVEIERRRIGLDEPIKSLGEFTVPVRLHGDVTAQLKVSVSRE